MQGRRQGQCNARRARAPGVCLLRLPAQSSQPSPHRPSPRPPAHRQSPRRRPPASGPGVPRHPRSDPAGPPCSPHGCPPPPPRTPPAVSRKPPHCASGCARLTPRRTPTPAKSSTWPASRKTHPRLPRCGPGSSNDSATWNRTHADQRPAHRLGPRRRHQQRPVTPGRLAHARRHPRRCPCQPPGPPVRRIRPKTDLQTNKTTRSASTPPSPPAPRPPWPTSSQAASPPGCTGGPGRIGPFPATPQNVGVATTTTYASAGQAAMATMGATVGWTVPPAGSTVMPKISPGSTPETSTGPVRPPREVPSKPCDRILLPFVPISQSW